MVSSIIKSGKNFVTRKQDTVISAALVIMTATIITKLLGIIKYPLLANTFGAGRDLDIFIAANTIPTMVFNILVTGCMNTALIPVLLGIIDKDGEKHMWKVFNTFLNISAFFLIASGIIGIIFARYITFGAVSLHIIQNNIPFSLTDRDLMTQMMRVMFVSPVILGVSFLIGGALTVYKRFLITQLASVLYSCGFIAGIIIFVPIMGPMGLAWGVIFSSLVHLVIQYPVLRHLGYNYTFSWRPDYYVHRIWKLMVPRVIGLTGDQVGTLVDTILALGLLPGSLTVFTFAYTLVLFPISLVGWSFAQASFVSLAEIYAKGDYKSFKRMLLGTFHQIAFLTLPLTMIFIILRFPIVRLVFGQGKGSQFGWDATQVTAWVLLFFSLGILSQSILSLLVRAYYAMHDTKTPLKVGLFSLVINIGLSFYLIQVFGRFNTNASILSDFLSIHWIGWARGAGWQAVGGLALSSAIASTVNIIILLVVLSKRLQRFSIEEFWEPLAKKFISTICMGWIMYILFKFIDGHINTTRTFDELFLFIFVSVVGIVSYITFEYLLNDKEVGLVYKVMRYIQRLWTTHVLPPVSALPDLFVEEEALPSNES